jgi:Luciferase-like monooxygenase
MTVQLGAFLRTTLPLGLDNLADYDSGRYHSLWLPDHFVSFWPDSIWTPEFTDLAVASPSPHRHLDALAVAGTVAALTKNTPISTLVVDTVRRHPVMLAQTALTLSHLSKGRFILGLGSGEIENVGPYGFDFRKPVSRMIEAVEVIKLLWHSDSPVNFAGEFFHLEHARLDTEPYEGKFPPIYMAAGGPRTLKLLGRHGDGWFPGAIRSPEHYAEHLGIIHQAAEEARSASHRADLHVPGLHRRRRRAGGIALGAVGEKLRTADRGARSGIGRLRASDGAGLEGHPRSRPGQADPRRGGRDAGQDHAGNAQGLGAARPAGKGRGALQAVCRSTRPAPPSGRVRRRTRCWRCAMARGLLLTSPLMGEGYAGLVTQ